MGRRRGARSPSRRSARRRHRLESVVVNTRHVWRCRYCDQHWTPDVDVQEIERQQCKETP